MKARVLLVPLACLLAAVILYLAVVSSAPAHRLSGHPRTVRGKLAQAKRQVWHDRDQIRHFQLMAFHWLARDRAYVRRLQRILYRPVLGPGWLVNAFMCIHRGEGSWTDPAPPYYGGLQMDWSFMATYGPELLRRKGTADHWTPGEQIMVAVRAYNSGRGFYPWPNTARACGLLR